MTVFYVGNFVGENPNVEEHGVFPLVLQCTVHCRLGLLLVPGSLF